MAAQIVLVDDHALVRQGFRREAAVLMGVGEKTIERHRANIRSKHALSDEAFASLLGAR